MIDDNARELMNPCDDDDERDARERERNEYATDTSATEPLTKLFAWSQAVACAAVTVYAGWCAWWDTY